MDVPINVDDGKVSWWVWVTSEIAPKSLEEVSGIDDENYVIITEEDVVDGIANFIARCILENQKSKVCFQRTFYIGQFSTFHILTLLIYLIPDIITAGSAER